MYAIVKVGNHQYKVAEGDTIEADRLDVKEGEALSLDNVLLVDNGKDVQVGRPYVKGAKVTAKVVEHVQGEKRVAYKYRLRKDSQSKHGFRPQLTKLSIQKIAA